MRRLATDLVLWIPVGIVPILNGAVRMALYARALGEPRASRLSSALDVAAIVAWAWLAQRRWPAGGWGGAARRGVAWLAATTATHFGLGALAFGIPMPALAAKYDLRAGELWGIVSLAILAAPALGRWTAGRLPEGGAPDA